MLGYLAQHYANVLEHVKWHTCESLLDYVPQMRSYTAC
uniref:Uncharacterized protein n=1 Tax=Anguilla anguilla TaxID=7936 RepID=A0A0E9SBE4_ANGAN